MSLTAIQKLNVFMKNRYLKAYDEGFYNLSKNEISKLRFQ